MKPPASEDGPNADPSVANPPYIGTELAAERARNRNPDDNGPGGGGGDGSSDLSLRVSHLESRMGSVETKIDTVIQTLGGIATRSETRNYVVTAIAIFVALIAVLVTAMGWLETRAARVQSSSQTGQPIVIQVPTPAPYILAPVSTKGQPASH